MIRNCQEKHKINVTSNCHRYRTSAGSKQKSTTKCM